ncbi:VCBS repeat-containing protein [Streptomyces sp. WAC05374]|uniref:FG-GAP repeat domain-containing protein n=1 Tax=Streptomyces sp. WAC05374 TaxID=2487420 RepID=UPI000F87A2EC|nr:VCBS repeat-containing protein [Streptomyces sp. WAC05374]RST17452.1 VCBS repeat-containing protein [Streptomyces sp. WAC05374]TDF36818.1 VCBS repeat-containing protein [Streptomyces sp. WAC05374]TDF46306.1 VCBS repeat-containing protein [Streptomyces sp. WAC05374]TDF46871.1 VCBS repeat-containing protein [Streptomyces sp. WAC05374]
MRVSIGVAAAVAVAASLLAGSAAAEAAPGWRDFSGPADGYGDLVVINPDSSASFFWGSGAGGLRAHPVYWGQSAGFNHFVALSDLNGDGCNDLLSRRTNGDLYREEILCSPGMGGQIETSRRLGTGWNQFNVLTSPGDMTGDGRADLIARQATTGDMYLYANEGTDLLKARGRIGTNWKLYRAVLGAGDLNGDGIGDVLAVDRNDSLWRYDGTAAGSLKPRTLVFGNRWATSRNAFVGVGDITGDGHPDVISRNAQGQLLRNSGTGTGTFRSTVKIATAGWDRYKALF